MAVCNTWVMELTLTPAWAAAAVSMEIWKRGEPSSISVDTSFTRGIFSSNKVTISSITDWAARILVDNTFTSMPLELPPKPRPAEKLMVTSLHWFKKGVRADFTSAADMVWFSKSGKLILMEPELEFPVFKIRVS